MTRQHLLPSNLRKMPKAASEALDRDDELAPPIETARGIKYQRPLIENYAPWVLDEYGLGGIQRFFDTIEEAIDAGIPWQRKLGTVGALSTSFAWIGYDDITVWHQWRNRRKWNRYQIEMGTVPDVELPLLLNAEFLADLSDPARSVFFRGFEGYDVRALVWSGKRWGNAIWGDASGVRIADGTVKWSHGLDHTGTIAIGKDARDDLGISQEVGPALIWGEFPWSAPGVSWEGIADVRQFLSFMLRQMPVYVCFLEGDDIIGFRKPFAVRDITDHEDGGTVFSIEVECRTAFGDGVGRTATEIALAFDCRPADPDKPGKQWLTEDEADFEWAKFVRGFPIDTAMRQTVRHHVTARFDVETALLAVDDLGEEEGIAFNFLDNTYALHQVPIMSDLLLGSELHGIAFDFVDRYGSPNYTIATTDLVVLQLGDEPNGIVFDFTGFDTAITYSTATTLTAELLVGDDVAVAFDFSGFDAPTYATGQEE